MSKSASPGQLLSADLPNFPKEWEPLLRFLNDSIGGVSRALAGQLDIPTNFRCDVVAGVTMTHAVPTLVRCPRLQTANVCVVLASTPQISYSYAACARAPGGALVTCWFQSGAGTSKVTLLFLDVPGADANVAPSGFASGLPSGGSAGNVLTLAGSPLSPTWAPVSVPSSTAAWTLAEKPGTPDARDEEFEGASAAADGWTRIGTLTAGNPSINFTVGNFHTESYNGMRRSCELIQPGNGGVEAGLRKAKTFDNNYAGSGLDFVWARVNVLNRQWGTPATAQYFSWKLGIWDAAYANELASISVNWLTANLNVVARAKTTNLQIPFESTTALPTIAYVGIARMHNSVAASCNYRYFAAPESGVWAQLGPDTVVTAELASAGMVSISGWSSYYGAGILCCDFVRFRSDGTLP